MERLLIGMLGREVVCQSYDYDTSYHRFMIYCKFNPVVTSITFSVKFTPYYGSGTDTFNCNTINIFGFRKNYSDKDGSVHTETIEPTNWGIIEVRSLFASTLTITSFTTADGKVHTADNFNY